MNEGQEHAGKFLAWEDIWELKYKLNHTNKAMEHHFGAGLLLTFVSELCMCIFKGHCSKRVRVSQARAKALDGIALTPGSRITTYCSAEMWLWMFCITKDRLKPPIKNQAFITNV